MSKMYASAGRESPHVKLGMLCACRLWGYSEKMIYLALSIHSRMMPKVCTVITMSVYVFAGLPKMSLSEKEGELIGTPEVPLRLYA